MIRRYLGASSLSAPEVSWEQDYALRVNPALMTSLLHDAVPVLKHVDWRVTRVEPGVCESCLPLNHASTNQHGTHQAALISLAGDYTGGLALATLLRGVPLAGVHPCNEFNSAALWLAGMNVRYKSPSTGHLTISCTVPEDTVARIQERYFSGRRLIVPLQVIFTSNLEVVAEAEMTYFAQASQTLRPTADHPRLTTLYKHKLKASARMIAALRATIDDDGRLLRFDPGMENSGRGGQGVVEAVTKADGDANDGTDTLTAEIGVDQESEPSARAPMRPGIYCHSAHSAAAAGPHGFLLADYLTSVLPQLKAMVVARTQHIDATLDRAAAAGARQVVTPSVGLDFRVFRFAQRYPHLRFYETDLPEMLQERDRTLLEMEPLPAAHREVVPVNFELDLLDEKLLSATSFDPDLPTVVIYEGCSMYFDEPTNQRVFQQMRNLMRHPASLLWTDLVTTSVAEGTTDQPGIVKFLEGMDRLGEAFIFGVDDPPSWLSGLGFQVRESLTAGDYLRNSDPAFGVYRFVTAGIQ